MVKLSVVIISKNEEENIRRCLNSLSFCDEVVVVDDFSDDKTTDLARNVNAKVYKRKLEEDYASQKNFALSKASGEWILSVDADEVVSKKLADEIEKAINNPLGNNGYFIRRQDYVFGKKLHGTELGNVNLLRLAKRGNGKWERKVHEVWNVAGKKGQLYNKLTHYSHDNLAMFIDDVNNYSAIHARENLNEGKVSSLLKIILWPCLKFLNNYLLKKGYKDGNRGFVVSMLMSFHSFLAWSTLWLTQRNSNKV